MKMQNAIIVAAGLSALAVLASTAPAATLLWNGSTTDWGSPTAWSLPAGGVANAVPGPADNAGFSDLAVGTPITADAGAAGRTVAQLQFGANANNASATNPLLTRPVVLTGGTISLTGAPGGGSNFVGVARPEANTGGVTINNNLALIGTTATEQRFNIEAGDPVVVNGAITGTQGLQKVGAGTLVVNGDTSYAGLTTVRTGTFELNGTATAPGGYTVLANGRLAGTGGIVGSLAVGGGTTTLAPGAGTGVGTFDVSGNAAFQLSTIQLDVGPAGVDRLSVLGTLSLGNTTKLALTVPQTLTATAYVLADYGTLSGTFAAANVSGVPSGYELQYDYNNARQIALVAVPEPALVGTLVPAALLLSRGRGRGR